MNRCNFLTIIGFTLVSLTACAGLSDQHPLAVVKNETERAREGDVDAQLSLANRYRDGDVVQADEKAALNWYLRAAEQQSASGAFEASRILLADADPGNDAKAEALLSQAASRGFPPAQYRYAIFLDNSAEQNDESLSQIFELYLAAAKAGISEAQYEAANRLATGRGTAPNTRLAFEWYQRSAEQGDARAQLALGDYYLIGIGIPADLQYALLWYERSAIQGSVRAQSNLGDLLTLDRYAAVNDLESGVEWYRSAANQGYAHAQSRLGHLYEIGSGVAINLEVSAQWYRSAAEQGLASAQCRLGSLYLRGAGVNQSTDDAIRLFNQAAAQVPAGVMPLLGIIYYDCEQFDKSTIGLNLPIRPADDSAL